MSNKLKIFAIADTHGIDLTDKVKKANDEKVDVVVIAGDFSPNQKLDYAPRNLIGPWKSVAEHILLVHGNHDSEATVKFLSERYGAKNLHGYATMVGDVGFFGAGGAEIGPLPTSEADILEALEQAHDKVKHAKRKVMITHAHPFGGKLDLSVFPGSEVVKHAILKFQPDIAICGHAHEASGMEEIIGKTRVVNVSKAGKVLEI